MPLFSRNTANPTVKKGRKLPPIVTPSLNDELPPTPRGKQVDRRAGPLSPVVNLNEFGGFASGSRTLPSRPLHSPLTPPRSPSPAPMLPPKHTFLPTYIPVSSSSNSVDSFAYSSDEGTTLRQYGFLSNVGAGVILGVEDVAVVLRDVGKELQRRALTTPMLFSNLALELNQARTKLLIQNYLGTISTSAKSNKTSYNTFLHDLKFAKETELAWLLRWALGKILRINEATRETSRGILEWEAYEEWRGRERAANYPADAYPFLANLMAGEIYTQILTPLLRLLSRFAANSHLSGLTPHSLSSLFAPLIFGLDFSQPSLSVHATYIRSAYATEHLLLAYIRSSGVRDGVGISDLPSRLKEWVGGYPGMLASDSELAKGSPRRGARVVRCERATRVVRAYSRDLITAAEGWYNDLPGGTKWEAWESTILPTNFKLSTSTSRPKFSSSYRRKLCIPATLPLPSTSSSLSRQISYGKAAKPGSVEKESRGRVRRDGDGEGGEEEARFGSLAGKEWSLFEEGGFDDPQLLRFVGGKEGDIKTRLQFDLTESAKLGISERRQTMDWTDFASPGGGFNRTEPLLKTSLTFSSPLSETISHWPKEREDLRKRLVKSQKDSVPFLYDTTPRFGIDCIGVEDSGMADSKGRVYVEEGFVDFWADFGYGAGWVEREELTFKQANWVLIEYKARPSRLEDEVDALADPRTANLFFLFEERVPLDYQHKLADPKTKKTLGSLFSPRSKKRQPTTPDALRPYPSRTTPLGSPTATRPSDFDRMLLNRIKTKKVTLTSGSDQPNSTVWHLSTPLSVNATPNSNTDPSPTKKSDRSGTNTLQPNTPATIPARERTQSAINLDDPRVTEGKASFFATQKNRVIRRVKTDEETRERARRDREKEFEFELRSTSGGSSGTSPKDGEEKWMDILVDGTPPRLIGQDAQPPPPKQNPKYNKGLPVSPHPPLRRQNSSPPPDATYTSRAGQDPYHTPETSNEYPSMLPYDHDIPSSPEPVLDQSEEYEEKTSSRAGVIAPTPVRDTVMSVVDRYRRESYTEEEREDEGRAYDEQEEEDEGTEGSRRSRRESVLSDNSDISLEPPKPVFDLTPGREPSPARYKHGEPLQFVGEVPEEE